MKYWRWWMLGWCFYAQACINLVIEMCLEALHIQGAIVWIILITVGGIMLRYPMKAAGVLK